MLTSVGIRGVGLAPRDLSTVALGPRVLEPLRWAERFQQPGPPPLRI